MTSAWAAASWPTAQHRRWGQGSGPAAVGGGSEGDRAIAGGFYAGRKATVIGVRPGARPGQKLHPRGDDLMLAARVALLVLPGAVLQPAFHQRWGAFLQILAAGLGLGPEDHDVDEAGGLAPLAIWPLTRVLTANPRVATGVPVGL
jgi:hypothetical protein